MPIYEYSCEKCGVEFEVEQRITENSLTEHEGCGGAVKRLISMTSFSLKGGGWYSDHYGLKSKGSAKEKASCPKSTEANAETKKEPKVESSSTTKTETPAKPGSSSNAGKAA